MEVTCGNYHVLVREDVGVVRGTVNLVFNYGTHIVDVVLYGAVYLRDAAEGIGVLYVLLIVGRQLAAFQEFYEAFAGVYLAFVGAQLVR